MAIQQIEELPAFEFDWSIDVHGLSDSAKAELNEILTDYSRLLNLPYTATVKQMQAHTHPARGRAEPLFFGGAFGGAKTSYLCGEAIRECREVDGNRWFMARLTLVAFRDTTLDGLLEFIDHGGPGHEWSWNKNEHTFERRANGSQIRYGGIGTEADIKRHGSAQFGGIAIDEAPEIEERLFYMLAARCRLPAAEEANRIKLRLTGNPWPGWIEQQFIKRPREGFQVVRSYVTDNPHISPSYIEDMRKLLPPPLFKAWLEGSWDFTAPMNTVIPLELVDQMIDRVETPDWTDCVWGVDVGITHDKTVVAQRAGVVFGILDEWVGLNTVESAQAIVAQYHATAPTMRPRQINVDIDGLGQGVRDRLIEAQQKGDLPMWPLLYIQGVHAQSSAFLNQESDNPFRYDSIKAENAFKFRHLAEGNRGQLLADPVTGQEDWEARADLSTPTWERRNARIVIESKPMVKKRLGHSPDRGDALLLTMYEGRRDESETYEMPVDPRTGEPVAQFETQDQELDRLMREREARDALSGFAERMRRGGR